MRKTKTSKLTLQTETLKDLQLQSAVGGGGFYILTNLCVTSGCTVGSGTSVINPSGGSQNPSGG
jgi:hypothetical protein